MRTLKLLLPLLCLALIIYSCKKGDDGPPGKDGNANVVQYSFGEQNFPATFYSTLKITTTTDTAENSVWLVYLYYAPGTRWYAVPGYGYSAFTQYRLSIGYISGQVNIFIDKVGPGEIFSKAKVLRIYGGAPVPGGRQARALPDIDLTDYEAVKRYYHLTE
jgi:hypothetical protein